MSLDLSLVPKARPYGDRFIPGPSTGTPPADVRGVGVSHYTVVTDPQCDPAAFAAVTRDLGSQHTRIAFLFPDAWAIGTAHGGQYDGLIPWARRSDGRFDLFDFEPRFWNRLDQALDAFAACGIHVVLTCLELYSWSRGKSGLPWVPDRDVQPQRLNVNGVSWGSPDDDAGGFFMLPDPALRRLLWEIVSHVQGRPGVSLEIGNEMPEKEMHYRIRDGLRAAGYTGQIQVNRNEDTPGQPANMKIGRDFDRLALHGRDDLSYLDEDFPREPVHRTFRSAWSDPSIDRSRIVMSTDGVGFNQPPFYDRDALVAVVHDHLSRGMAVEHQARELKLGRFLRGRYDLADLDADLIRRMVAR